MLSIDLSHRVGDFQLAARFETRRGIAVLFGPSGAGKSLTLRLIAGIDRPGTGHIHLEGDTLVDTANRVLLPPQERRVGMVFQDSLLLPHRSVLGNVALAVRQGSRANRRHEARRWLQEVEASAWSDRYPHQLSGGQAQRVALARALAGSPRILLLDEPFSALDRPVRQQLGQLLRRLVERWQVPALLVTHDSREAAVLSDRMVILEEGMVTHQGSLGEITRHPRSPWAAKLAGTNLYRGIATGHDVLVGETALHLAEKLAGDVFALIHPSAVALHGSRPTGSPRNVWEARVSTLEPVGERVRVGLVGPLPIVAEVTASAAAALGLAGDNLVWVSIKATEIETYPT